MIDLFSGTSRVGHALKGAGYRVIANDHNAYAKTLAMCYVQADRSSVVREAEVLISEFNAMAPAPGYFTETFCVKSRFFRPQNGERIDAIREAIAMKGLGPELESVLLVSLMEAADRVDSTTGVQMAFLKDWAPRATKEIELRMPDVLERPVAGQCEAHMLDASDAAERFEADVAYLDPPYNRHSYLGNYHIWETLVLWDKPDVYGVACKRVDVKERGSAFNSRPLFAASLVELIRRVRAPVVILSLSDDGFLSRDEIEGVLAAAAGNAAHVSSVSVPYPRYVGARIGIYSPSGERVGKVGRLVNHESLFVLTREGAEGACEVVLPRSVGAEPVREV